MRAAKEALEARLGTWRMATDMTRIPKAKAIVVIADDLEESHNVLGVRIKDAVANEKATLVVIGALRSELVDFAAHWIRPAAGEEGQAAASLASAVAGQGDASGDIAAAAAALRSSEGAIVICAPNPVSPAIAGAMAGGAANVAVALHGEAASDHLVIAPPEVNTHGLLDVGVAAEGSDDPLAGLSGLLVIRDDPTMRLPGAAAALEGLDALVVVDNVAHETAKRATAVLAEGRAYASRGTYTQGDFRVQRLEPAIAPEGEAVNCFAALSALAYALGVDVPADPETALAAIANETPAYQPAADLIIGEGVRMDVAPSGQGAIVPVADASASGEGLRIITGRDQYTATDAAALRHPEAEKLHRYDRFQVSEEDAERLGIADSDEIELTDGELTLRAPATVTDRVPEGAVYVSSLLQGGAVVGFFRSAAVPAVRVGAPVPA